MARCHYNVTTDRILTIHWSGRTQSTLRMERWGGLNSQWKTERLADDMWRIPKNYAGAGEDKRRL